MYRQPYTFSNCPYYQVAPADFNGWQVQWREDESSEWVDLHGAYYKNKHDAIDHAARLCISDGTVAF
jgi:hypothetical protein